MPLGSLFSRFRLGAVFLVGTFVPDALSALNLNGDADNSGAVEISDAALALQGLLGASLSQNISPLALIGSDASLGIDDVLIIGQMAQPGGGWDDQTAPIPLLSIVPPAPRILVTGSPDPAALFQFVSNVPSAQNVEGLEVGWSCTGCLAVLGIEGEVTGGQASALLTPQPNPGPGNLGASIVATVATHRKGGAGDQNHAEAASFTITPPVCGDGVLSVTEDCDDGNAQDDPVCGATCRRDPDAAELDGRAYRLDLGRGIIATPALFGCPLRSLFQNLAPWQIALIQTGPTQLQATLTVEAYATTTDNWGSFNYSAAPYLRLEDPTGFTVAIDATISLMYRNVVIEGYFSPGGEFWRDLSVAFEINLSSFAPMLGFDLCGLIPCTPDGYAQVIQTGALARYLSPTCGDGAVDPGEQCDDFGTSDEDGCSAMCFDESCGDGVVQGGLGEACDDGNAQDADRCPSNCQWAFCGDGYVLADFEECDQGAANGTGTGCELGCLLTPGSGPAAIAGVKALFSFAALAGGEGFFNFPWPSDLRRYPDGRMDLSGFPNPYNTAFLSGNLPIVENATDAFGTTAGIYAAFDGPVNPGTFPATPEDSRLSSASIFLMDVDPLSLLRGTRYPIQTYFSEPPGTYRPANLLMALPFPGIALRPRTQYALVITDAVQDLLGNPLGASSDFERVKDPAFSGIPEVDAAKALYSPVFSYLETFHGLPRSSIRAMTVYTTGEPTGGLQALAAAVSALPIPLYGSLGYTGIEYTYRRYYGSYDTPIYEVGSPPYAQSGGEIQFDAGGQPLFDHWESINFVLTTPTSTKPTAGWPVAVYAHGTGGSRLSPLGPSDEAAVLAANGIALLSINQPLHGDRVPPGSPDPELLAFNFFNILAGRDNWRQSAVDTLQAIRFAKNLVIPGSIAPGGQAVGFDPSRIYFIGHSQGAITGPLAIAFSDDVKGTVLSGSGGGLAQSILTKTLPVPIAPLALSILCQDPGQETLDVTHPILQLVQTFIEVSDTVNYGRFLLDEPVAFGKNVLLTSGLMDQHSTPSTLNAFATAIGMNAIQPVFQPIEGLALRGFGVSTAPVRGNRTDGLAVARTAGVIQYPLGDHFVIYTDPAARYTYGRFLGTHVTHGQSAICYSPTTNFMCSVCGNGTVEVGEACDDGNRAPGGGCNATCTGP